MQVATLVAPAAARSLTPEVIEQVRQSAGEITEVRVLTEGVVADFFGEISPQFTVPAGCDWIVQRAGLRHKKLLVCDLESTIVDNEFLDDIGGVMGKRAEIANITERAMRGELNFESALEARIALVAGMPQAELLELFHSRVKYNPGARELLAACRRSGVYTMLVSGGFTVFAEIVAKELGFDEMHANRLVFTGGILSGVSRPIVGAGTKLALLTEKAQELGIPLAATAAMGDGANDLPMLHGAGLGIGYRAKPLVQQEIPAQIRETDLMTMAYAIGAV